MRKRWHQGRTLSLIADSFDDFILKIEVNQEEKIDQDVIDKIQAKASPELLEMLRKSGFGKKK